MRASQLRRWNKEHPDNYSLAKLMNVCGAVVDVQLEGD